MRGSFKTHVFLCLILSITMLAMGCSMTSNGAQQTHHPSELQQQINNYIATYQARQDFEHFLSYYADDVQLEDMIYGFAVKDKQALAEFFNWSAGNVEILDGEQTFTLDEVIVNEQQRRAVIRGTYVRFMYEGRELGP
ncbi:hypothetical protein CWB99_09100 [Pseudoalteromonas rubra]|uniref:SnoaL-like domain-containing protein n=1 Tax=Pseudoalteromonas rubra TaxID=43658 RepID=A0A5S3WPU4_9GAMM|nr:nuclear transport factor 2 family protein [Pseudoalteromonas rubra]TMP29344.1 hypothetical protein CWB99_09100 [Pseudoalteromonas rubra]TMP34051.1 hypothetical protein CWC00_09140 [Pseudoalteromonas rubra]